MRNSIRTSATALPCSRCSTRCSARQRQGNGRWYKREKGKRLRPERGAKPPSESERGWGPASSKRSRQGKRHSFRNDPELAHSALEAAEIESTIVDDDGGGTQPELWLRGVTVVVRAEDAARAEE